MQSKAKTVTEYLKEVPDDRRDALTKLRGLFRSVLTDFDESMEYGGPCYSRDGEVEIGFASQKHFIGVYLCRLDVMNAYRDRLDTNGVSLGKSCIRYSKPEKIDFELVETMLRALNETTGPIGG